MTKAIFLDIDGTLVSFKTHTIPQSTIDALVEAHSKGVKIFIATGRPSVIINNLGALQERGIIDGYAAMNGAYCFVGDKVLHKCAIPAEDVRAIASVCKERDYACIFVREKSISACLVNNELREIFYNHLHVDHIREVDFEEAVQGEILMVTPFMTKEQEQEIIPLTSHCEIGRWHPAFSDISASGNTKQHGIDIICSHFGIRLEDTMAIGDGGNDISMLKHAGIGIAMGNANEEVKSYADYVTTSVDEDGIANALKHFGII